ncbi:hypothetical protein BaRGS_00008954, partial [Batillaria attramentaria]
MAELRHFNSVVKEYADLADFRIVYVQESHPTDGWAFRNNYVIKHHRQLGDRMAAAEKFVSVGNPACPVLVDDVNGAATFAYGGTPERLYIVLDSRVVYAGKPGPTDYFLQEVEGWLAAFRQSKV